MCLERERERARQATLLLLHVIEMMGTLPPGQWTTSSTAFIRPRKRRQCNCFAFNRQQLAEQVVIENSRAASE